MLHHARTELLLGLLIRFQKLILKQSAESPEDKVASMLQYAALTAVSEGRGMTNSQLADTLCLSPSSATQLTERLVKVGFIERFSDNKDRRITRLKLTKLGSEELDVLRQKKLEKMKSVLSVISAEDQQHLVRIYSNLIEKLEQ